MQRLLRSICLLTFLGSLLLVPLHAGRAHADPSRSEVSAQTAGDVQVSVSLTSTQPSLRESQRADGTFTTFEGALSGEPGAPALPVVSRLVGIPAAVAPKVAATLAAPQAMPSAPHLLEPMPSYQSQRLPGSEGEQLAPVERYAPNSELYNSSEWYPAEPVTVSEPLTLREQAMVRVEFTPVQVNLRTGELRWIPAADITLDWAEGGLPPLTLRAEDPHFEDTFKEVLINYEQTRSWATQAAPAAELELPRTQPTESSWMIQIEGIGLYRVPLSELAAKGVDISRPERLALFYGSGATEEEQAIRVDSSYLYFVNTWPHSRWSEKVVFRLKVLPSGSGKRMADLYSPPTQPGAPLTAVPYDLRLEQDVTYMSLDSSARLGERWYWKKLNAFSTPPSTGTFDASFDLPHLTQGSWSATVTPEVGPLTGYEYGNCRRVLMRVNSASVQQEWSGTDRFEQVVTLPHSALSPTGNSIHMEHSICGTSVADTIMVNAFIVRYARGLNADASALFFDNAKVNGNYQVSNVASSGSVAFEVSDASTVRVLTGTTTSGTALTFGRPLSSSEQYLVTSWGRARAVEAITPYQDQGLRTDLTHTDYLLITHPDFAATMAPLVQWHQSQGLATRLVTTNAIYNDFGVGTMDPEAIRAFLQYAYDNWAGTPPSFVLLVGDGTYDPLDIMGTGQQVWMPPMLVYRDNYLGEVPSDNAFVADLASGSDDIPDMHIGRFPVNSVTEAAILVEKVQRYVSDPAKGDWKRSILFAADDPDGAGNFHTLSDNLLPLFPPRALVSKGYLPDPGTDVLTVRDLIKNSLNYGQLIVQYIGHGSPNQWASGNGGVWSLRRPIGAGTFSSDLNLLLPNTRLPMSLTWACWDGYFVKPDEQAMAESMIRLDDRGVIAAFSPVGLDTASGHDRLARGFFERLFGVNGGQPSSQLGPLTLAAKLEVSGTSWSRLIYTYILFGDPAMKLNLDPCLLNESAACSIGGPIYLPTVNR